MNFTAGRLQRSDEVYNNMLVRIADGEWREGEKIPSENQLCKMFAVSRISVRSAIQRLQGQGLLTTIQGVGSFVRTDHGGDVRIRARAGAEISGPAFMEFFEFRQALEFKAIDLFVVHATAPDIRNLRVAVAAMERCPEEKRAEFGRLDFDFHTGILRGSRNSYLIGAMQPYSDQYLGYLTEIVRRSHKPLRELATEHAALLELLRGKQPRAVKDFLLRDNQYYHVTYFDNEAQLSGEKT